MWFYVLFGFVLLFGPRVLGRFFAAYAVAIIGLHLPGIPVLGGLPRFIFNPGILDFMAGMMVAALARKPTPRFGVSARLAVFSAAAIFLGCLFPAGSNTSVLLESVFWGAGFGTVLIATLRIEQRLPLANLKPLVFAGDASYSIRLLGLWSMAGSHIFAPGPHAGERSAPERV